MGYRVETFYTFFYIKINKDNTLNNPRYFKITLQGKKKTGTVTLDVPSKDKGIDRNEILMDTWSDKQKPFSNYNISSQEDFTSNPDENNGQLTIPIIKEYHGEVTALAPTDPDVYFPQNIDGMPIFREFRIMEIADNFVWVGGYCLIKTAKFIKQESGGLFPSAKNEVEIFLAEKLTVSLYGEKLEEVGSVVINVGENGTSNFSLPENELTQNTENSQSLANSVISSYKDGKETALIRCSISKYYDTFGNLVISDGSLYSKYPTTGETTWGLSGYTLSTPTVIDGVTLYPTVKQRLNMMDWPSSLPFPIMGRVLKILDYKIVPDGATPTIYPYYDIKITDAPDPQFVDTGLANYAIFDYILYGTMPETEVGAFMYATLGMFDTEKMTFHLHDEVIPYIMGADGKDKPMSVYADGSPKVFQVLSSKIFYDGAVWQELEIQEKK